MKIAKKLLALVLSLGCIGAFAACDMSMLNSMLGGGTSDVSSENPSSENLSTDSMNSGNTEQPKGEQVSETEWNAAFEATSSASNVTISMGSVLTTMGRTNALKQLKTDNVTSITQTFTMDDVEQEETRYFEEVDGELFYYLMEGEEWVKYAGTDETEAWLAKHNSRIALFQGLYSQLTYDEEAKLYQGENVTAYSVNGQEAVLTKVTVAFEDGKVREITYETEEESDGYIRCEAFGETKVDLPAKYRDESKPAVSEGMTEEEWHTAFANSYAKTNYTISVESARDYIDGYGEDDEMSVLYYVQPTSLKHEQTTSTNEYVYYYDTEGDSVVRYEEKDGVWKKEEYTPRVPFGSALITSTFMNYEGLYSQLTYDAEKDVYAGENVTITVEGMEVALPFFSIQFENGLIKQAHVNSEIISSQHGVIGRADSVITISDYDKTVIEFPKIENNDGTAEEEWHTAFANTYAYSNYTMSVSSHYTFTDGREDTSTYTYQCQPTVMKVDYSDYDMYYALEGDAIVQYRKSGSEWVKNTYIGTMLFGSELVKINLERFEELYEHFTYNEAEGCWYAENILTETNGREMFLYELRVIIENGLVVKAESVSDLVSNDGVIGRSSSTITVSDFDTTVVKLPKLGNAQQVTEDEWKAALSATVNATNVSQSMCYTFEYTDGTPTREYESYMLLQENATYQYGVQSGTPYQQYYAKVDGVDYAYKLTDGVWTRSEAGVEITYTNNQMASTLDPMQAIYADFTFNADKGVYTCAEVIVPLGGGSTQTMYNAEFGFEDGNLVHFYYEVALTDSNGVQNGTAKVTLTYWAYGETSFELPEIAE